jgi:hypothetical protein
MHWSQRRLCRIIGVSLGIPKMYYSMPINMFFIVKNHWEPSFTDNPRNWEWKPKPRVWHWVDKERCIPMNPEVDNNSRQLFGSMYCYNTTVCNDSIQALRKVVQNSPVMLLQGLFTHSKYLSLSCRTFYVEHLSHNPVYSRDQALWVSLLPTKQLAFYVINLELWRSHRDIKTGAHSST